MLLFCLPLMSQSTQNGKSHPLDSIPDKGKEKISVTNVEILNSIYQDYNPILFDGGILFTSDRLSKNSTKKKAAHFYFSPFDSLGNLQAPSVYKGGLNSSLQEGLASISHDEKTIVFSRAVRMPKQTNGFSDVRLYSATMKNGKWENEKKMVINMENVSSGHPAFSPEDDQLFFASNRPNGYGGTDIYVSEKINGVWTKPRNLGSQINTAKNELFPFVDKTGTLYFSSNRKTGIGQLDIYKAVKGKDGMWTYPVLLEAPYNSLFNDFGFYTHSDDNKSGYLSSNREGGLGGNDIYEWKVVEEGVDEKEINEEEFIGLGSNMNSLNTESEQERILKRDEENKAFLESVSIPETDEEKNGKINELESISSTKVNDKPLVLPIIYYDFNSDEIRDKDKNYLKDLAKYLKDNPSLILSIHSYSDPRGKKLYNKWLTKKRAERVMTYLVDLGVEQTRLNAEGKGELMPLTDAEGLDYSKSRKTEFVINNSKDELGDRTNTISELDLPKLQVSSIYYGFDSYKLNTDSKLEVEKLVRLLIENPELKVEIRSHTDARGNKKYNQWLSQKRANEVVRHLVSNGIQSSRLKAVGVGESELLNRCSDGVACSKKEHLENRRTEFVFVR